MKKSMGDRWKESESPKLMVCPILGVEPEDFATIHSRSKTIFLFNELVAPASNASGLLIAYWKLHFFAGDHQQNDDKNERFNHHFQAIPVGRSWQSKNKLLMAQLHTD